eukprot:CAMPEP_0168324558 /NCGR_PEP_ID=MMETSP0213-20121227/4160_1 /TAXON_ID=151035 /ORGANISM="Euplotes harpa, Strain FSP1.4" /LENGTH=159 /DNA_ID=CAMNT_0008326867 /DNA_START=69 /DNA_END=545 /DNA_ORIENTATION=+
MVCAKHKQGICVKCAGDYHACCDAELMGSTEVVVTVAGVIEDLLTRIRMDGEYYKLDHLYEGYNRSLDDITQEYAVFRQDVAETQKSKDIFALNELQKKVFIVRKHVEKSHCFLMHSVHMNLRGSTARRDLKIEAEYKVKLDAELKEASKKLLTTMEIK